MKCDFKKKKYKTKVLTQFCDEGREPVNWNQEFWLPAQIPVLVPKIFFRLMDEDKVNDETAGSCMFFTKELIENAIEKEKKRKKAGGVMSMVGGDKDKDKDKNKATIGEVA